MVMYLRLARRAFVKNVIKLAGHLGECSFDDIDSIYKRCMKSRCLRMFVCDNDKQLFEFNRLPSGRYWTFETRVAIELL